MSLPRDMARLVPSLPVWSKTRSQHDEDVTNPTERVMKTSFSEEERVASVAANLTLLWMERASWYLVPSCYLCKINTHLLYWWVSQRQQRRPPAVIPGVQLWSGRIRNNHAGSCNSSITTSQLRKDVCTAPTAGMDTQDLLPTLSRGGDGAIWSWDRCCASSRVALGSSLTLLFHWCLLRSRALTLGKKKGKSELIQLGETIEEEGSKAKRHMKNLKSRRQQYFQGFMWH